jgi:protein-tyrosine phosphatase
METPFRILFVCMGNICRSPAGECVLRHLADASGQSAGLGIDSAGTIDFHTGKPPDSRMRDAGAGRGIVIQGSARQVRRGDLEKFDLILAADRDNRADLIRLAGGEGAPGTEKIRLFCEFCTRHDDKEVPDPYYGGDAGFEHVLDLLEDGCANLLDRLKTGSL